jgi:hypothetical protein
VAISTTAIHSLSLTSTHLIVVIERMAVKELLDFAMNLLYVIGFLSCRDGGTEAGRVLGLLFGLPNDTTMER